MIKIFDSACHPTISGKWKTKFKVYDSSFQLLNKNIKKNNFYKVCALGLYNFENYEHKIFFKKCSMYPNMIPVAGINPNIENLEDELLKIIKIGYKIVKIHPRISSLNLKSLKFINCLKLLEKNNLKLMLCTYPFGKLNKVQKYDFFDLINNAFSKIKSLKTVLLHGGSVRLLEFAEFVRNNPDNFLLDLSMTMQKYRGSSIEQDIRFLFKNFDERICIGSDHPEFSLKRLRSDFNYYSKNISKKKKENISFKNLNNFLS